MFGICNLAIIPLRAEASDRSEIVSQVLFGEHFKVLETVAPWAKIQLQYDGYKAGLMSSSFRRLLKNNTNNCLIGQKRWMGD